MNATSSEAAPALGKNDLGIEQHSQDTLRLEDDKLGDTAQERRRLEVKLCACLALGGTNGYPIHADRIKDKHLRTLAGAAMICRNWSISDLEACSGNLTSTAAEVARVARRSPHWTAADFRAFDALEKREAKEERQRP